VSNTEARVSAALQGAVEEIQPFVREQAVVYADETGHKVAGERAHLWLAASTLAAIFLIRESRARRCAQELLGASFDGSLVSDRWSAYNIVDTNHRQLCWAHLDRDFTKLSQREGRAGEIGDKLLAYVDRMFGLWHLLHEGKRSRRWFQRKMRRVREGVEWELQEGASCGDGRTERVCAGILKFKEALWTFVDVADVEPTNNFAERTLRTAVIWRKLSFGTQSERGNRFVERILTVVATCKLQGRNVLEYVTAAVQSHLLDQGFPSLVPDHSANTIAA